MLGEAKSARAARRAAVLIGLLVLVGAGSTATAQMKNRPDPILIQGHELPALNRTPIARLGVYAYRNGFDPIPFQVDERDRLNQWVLRAGPFAGRDADGGALDENDELVFMAFDMDGRAPANTKPPGATACFEAQAGDGSGSARAFAYVCSFPSPPALAKEDYAEFEGGPNSWLVKTPAYQLGGKEGQSYFDLIKIAPPAGPFGPDLVDAQKIRARVFLGEDRKIMQVTERNSATYTRGWCDGPVRVIRVRSGNLKIAALEITIPGFANNYQYLSFFLIPLQFDLPLNANFIFRHVDYATTVDFSPEVFGWIYYDALSPSGLNVDGTMGPEEKAPASGAHKDWYALSGKGQSVLFRIVMGPSWKGSMVPTQFYLDDAASLDPPEEIPGATRFGFRLKTVSQVPKGTHRYDLYGFFPGSYSEPARKRFFLPVDNPLQVEITAR